MKSTSFGIILFFGTKNSFFQIIVQIVGEFLGFMNVKSIVLRTVNNF